MIDDSNLIFNSSWEIDKLVSSDSKSISSGTTPFYTFSSSSMPPVFEAHFKPSGSNYWYRIGSYQDGATYGVFHAYISGTTIYIYSNTAGTLRWWVWSDKVNY